METINAPNFGVNTRIKKLKLEAKRITFQSEILDTVIKILLSLQVLYLVYWISQ